MGQGELPRVSQPAVLIVSGTPEFSQIILSRWQKETSLPPAMVMHGDLCGDFSVNSAGSEIGPFDLAILGGLSPDRLEQLLRQLARLGRPLLVLAPDAGTSERARSVAPQALILEQTGEWLPAFLLLAVETIRRIEAEARARRAAEDLVLSESSALLGRYMTEQRHSINNALTSVMGNAELLTFDAGNLSSHHLNQIETIRTMSIRIHEIMQRFSSLESEAKWAEKQRDHEQRKQASAAG